MCRPRARWFAALQVLVLDASGSGAGADRAPTDGSLSSGAAVWLTSLRRVLLPRSSSAVRWAIGGGLAWPLGSAAMETINGCTVVPLSEAPEPMHFGPAETPGAYLAMVGTFPPGHPASPLHVHPHTDEAFYVADGEATFQLGDRRGPGHRGGTRLRATGDGPHRLELRRPAGAGAHSRLARRRGTRVRPRRGGPSLSRPASLPRFGSDCCSRLVASAAPVWGCVSAPRCPSSRSRWPCSRDLRVRGGCRRASLRRRRSWRGLARCR